MITMKRKDKSFYEAPSITIVEVKIEGVICQSGLNKLDNPADYLDGGDPFVF